MYIEAPLEVQPQVAVIFVLVYVGHYFLVSSSNVSQIVFLVEVVAQVEWVAKVKNVWVAESVESRVVYKRFILQTGESV